MKNDENIVRWITVKGNHIPIHEGESEEDAINNFIGDKYESELPDKPLVRAARYFVGDQEFWAAALPNLKKYAGKDLRIEEEPLPKEPEFLKDFPRLKKMEDYKTCNEHINPNFNEGTYAWTYNCQRCVIAFEMRYRGYDVMAKPRLSNEDDPLVKGTVRYKDAFKNNELNFLEYYYPGERAKNVALIEENILKDAPCGARFLMRVTWRKHHWQDKPTGHAFIAIVNDKHELEYYDPQTGKRASWKKNANVPETAWMRIDNKELTKVALDCVYKKGENK